MGSEIGSKVIVLLEGRDGAGKTTTAHDLAVRLHLERCRVIKARFSPSRDAKSDASYFDRWLDHLPMNGRECEHGVSPAFFVFDRSWYNRALVERVMSFCTREELEQFFATVRDVEADLVVRCGFRIVKVFIEISSEEQSRRLAKRRERGELSSIDAEAIARRDLYAEAEREMFERTSFPSLDAVWTSVPESDRATRLTTIIGLFGLFETTSDESRGRER
jgi:polyphosphate kinase 2 (PPK2 family)